MGLNEQQANTILLEVNILTRYQNWFEDTRSRSPAKLLSEWLSDEYIQRYLGVNRHKGILWFRKEAYEKLIWWMSVVAVIQSITNVNASAASFVEQVLDIDAITQTLLSAEEESQYQVAKLLEAVELKSAARPL